MKEDLFVKLFQKRLGIFLYYNYNYYICNKNKKTDERTGNKQSICCR